MKTKAIRSNAELQTGIRGLERAFLLLYKGGAEQSDCALERISSLRDIEGIHIFAADVNHVRDIHHQLGVRTVPTLVIFHLGRPVNVIKGCRNCSTYESIFTGRELGIKPDENGKKIPRVVVYTSPACTWCNTLKTYLEHKQIPYREINVAADNAQAEAMVRKSGQQGVPQTEINGQIIVGFDKPRINQMLGIE